MAHIKVKTIMRERILNLLDHLSNIKWDIVFFLKKITDKKLRIVLSENKKLKNTHLGERCFIIGNGPSLTQMDLSKLRNEYTFTVNHLMNNRHIYDDVYSDCHVVVDPLYFQLNPDVPEEVEVLNSLKAMNYAGKQPICITLYEGYNAFKTNKLNRFINFRYLYSHRNFTKSYHRTIDLSKNSPSVQNVVQAAILAAVYMGFKEIYLIGCDMTSVFMTYEANAEDSYFSEEKNYHAYQYNNNDKKFFTKYRYDNESMLYDYAKTFTVFKRIKEYTERHNIKIYNATIGGGLDIFQRIKYTSLF